VCDMMVRCGAVRCGVGLGSRGKGAPVRERSLDWVGGGRWMSRSILLVGFYALGLFPLWKN
jgi:hypothetical protein